MTKRKMVLLALLGFLLIPAPSWSQGIGGIGFNGKARTYVSYLQVRNLVQDSILAYGVQGEGTQRTLDDGTRVTCDEDWCRYFRSGSDVGMVPFLQDFQLNGWSGIQGLRGYAHVRLRQPWGDGRYWPRMENEVEALAAYLEYRRSFYTVKMGRIWESTGLGFYNYDGGSLRLDLPRRVEVNVYGGLALVRGLNELHHSELIGDVEPLEPREDAYLFGFHGRWRPTSRISTSLTYQRESMTHAGDLYSERIAGTARVRLDVATVNAEVKYDLATETTNLAKLAISAPLPYGLKATGEVRRYAPFFQLWTIWGAFSPVGYDEVRTRVDWMSSTGRFSARGHWSYRMYGDTETSELVPSMEVSDDHYRMGIGGRYLISEDLTVDGEYRHDVGFGASRSGGDVFLQKSFGAGKYVALKGTGFETFSEFGVGSGRILGGGVNGAMPIGGARVQAGAMFYKHTQEDQPQALDLNQARLNLILEIPIGGDPGMRKGGDR